MRVGRGRAAQASRGGHMPSASPQVCGREAPAPRTAGPATRAERARGPPTCLFMLFVVTDFSSFVFQNVGMTCSFVTRSSPERLCPLCPHPPPCALGSGDFLAPGAFPAAGSPSGSLVPAAAPCPSLAELQAHVHQRGGGLRVHLHLAHPGRLPREAHGARRLPGHQPRHR